MISIVIGSKLRKRWWQSTYVSRAKTESGNGELSGLDQLASSFLRAEYDSLRAEGSQARQAQQSILQWSLAIIGVLLGAGIVVASQSASATGSLGHQHFMYLLFVILFGFVLPMSAWFSCLSWFGELIRMERTGRYLRGLETVLSNTFQDYGAHAARGGRVSYLDFPLRWETYIGAQNMLRVGVSKQRVGYVGALGLYFGSVLVPLGIFIMRVWIDTQIWDITVAQVLLTAYALTILSAFTGSIVLLVRALQRAGREAANLDAVVPGARNPNVIQAI